MLHELSLTAMIAAIDRGDCTANAVWASCTAHIQRTEPRVHAWAHMPRLEAPDGGNQSSTLPLRGLPFGVKDTIDVKDMPCERGSAIWKGRVADSDASVTSLLQAAGGCVMGKTVTTEFAYFRPGITANPHKLDCTPGGSSSGSAAAVAACMVPFALGSQTAASLIRPAAYCGVVGYVMSTGITALRGVTPLAQSLDAIGMMARDMGDLQLLGQVLQRNNQHTHCQSTMPSRILLVDGRALGPVDDDMNDAMQEAVHALQSVGVAVEGLSQLVDDVVLHEAAEVHRRLMAYEAYENLAFEYANFKNQLSAELLELLEHGRSLRSNDRAELIQRRHFIALKMAAGLGSCDAFLAPAANGAAPLGLSATGKPDQSRPWQLLGLPQITLPFKNNLKGLPLGLQLISARNQDVKLLAIGRWLQDRLGWKFTVPKT
jgi:Asp-tRNA(Asn)/Glu-tRNA(Gln) amidotransferase A subunit family amidase